MTDVEYPNETFTRWAMGVIDAARAIIGYDPVDVAVWSLAKGNCSWCGELVLVALRRNSPTDPNAGGMVVYESDDVRGDLIIDATCDHRAGHRALFDAALKRLDGTDRP